jgi:Concanavalin A-like lectin/glucanases superfamily
MERSWVYVVVGAAALFVVTVAMRHFSSSESEVSSPTHTQVAAVPERMRSQGGGWIARQGEPEEPGAPGAARGSAFGRRGADVRGGGAGPDDTGSGRRGASVIVDRGRGPTGGASGSGFMAGGPGVSGGDALHANSGIAVADTPFEGARSITGPIGGGGPRGTTQDTVEHVVDKPGDNLPPPEDGGPVLSLPFDRTTEPERGDNPVVEQGVTFDSGDGARFSTDSQFVVPDGGNLKGDAGTISMWVQPDWAGGDESNASLAQLRNPNQWEDRLQIFKNGVYMRFLMGDTAGQESNIGTNISDWAPGEWHQVVASWGQNENGQLMQSFYIDGRLIGQAPVSGGFNVHPGTPLYIGSDMQNGVPGANGAISNFLAYNRPLTPDEVANLAANPPK